MWTRIQVTNTENLTSEKALGVIIDQALNFSEHISSKVNKANRNLGMIFKTYAYMEKEFFNLYKSTVRPHLEHSVCTPLYKKDILAIENVKRRATKQVKSICQLTYQEGLKLLGFHRWSTGEKEPKLLKFLRY